jgi:DNA-binding transcriptional MerR regulator
LAPNEHTLDDLVAATGFSKRQIRFYITKKLVLGAGESRGPGAVYGEETLQRLRLIRVLKDKRIEPTGRQMSLDEIGHALDALSADGIESLVAGRSELSIVDTDSGRVESLAAPVPDALMEPDAVTMVREFEMPRMDLPAMASLAGIKSTKGGEAADETPLRNLLERLQALLAGPDPDTRSPRQANSAERWLRVASPDVEIHVRQPDDRRARARLAAMARDLARMLERED